MRGRRGSRAAEFDLCWASTLAVESLRKTGHEGNSRKASFDPRRCLSASLSGELAVSPAPPSILNLPTASVGDWGNPQSAPAGHYPQSAPAGHYPQSAPAGYYPQSAPAGYCYLRTRRGVRTAGSSRLADTASRSVLRSGSEAKRSACRRSANTRRSPGTRQLAKRAD